MVNDIIKGVEFEKLGLALSSMSSSIRSRGRIPIPSSHKTSLTLKRAI
jgi:hypothetical protein